jgi:hypothetical protein
VSGLVITVGGSGYGVNIEHGQFNKVSDCTVIGVSPIVTPGQSARVGLTTFLAANNTFTNCTLEGTFEDAFSDHSQAAWFATSLGNNNFTGVHFANPTQ